MPKRKSKNVNEKKKSNKISLIVNIVLIFVLIAIFIKFNPLQNNDKITYIPVNYSFYSIGIQQEKFITVQFDTSQKSMTPCLYDNVLGTFLPYKDIQLKQGDIISYKTEENQSYYIVHRVIQKNLLDNGKIEYIVKGDNNNYYEKVYDNQIKYVLIEVMFPLIKKE